MSATAREYFNNINNNNSRKEEKKWKKNNKNKNKKKMKKERDKKKQKNKKKKNRKRRRKEGNVLFNDALNTFYLRLYGIRHMVKDHSDSERENPLPPHRLLFYD